MQKFKKFLKFSGITIVSIIVVSIISFAMLYYFSTKNISLDTSKLDSASAKNILICSSGDEIISPVTLRTKAGNLSTNTKNAFISAEDKRFYSHRGIDYIRLAGAAVNNFKSRNFSQGASTISQQLIKNTHLSNEKTIKRKLKEMKLARQLEKQFSKDEILEMYLNNIYFGNGCYGIENASEHYFSKPSSELTLSESAALAATINAPSIYDLESNGKKVIDRRNLILDLMYKQAKISKQDCENAKAEKLVLKISKLTNNNYIFDKIISEACSILKISENELEGKNLKIETDIDFSLQTKINDLIKKNYSNIKSSPEIACIVLSNKSSSILAMAGSKSTLESKKQPGSLAKPLFVYAPAIENGLISPATKILDEKVNFSGYEPENADKKYHGYVSARVALAKSYNIPAVKLLNELKVSNAIDFAKKMNINLEPQDNNLSIALGGLTKGLSLKTIADAYKSFANGGKFAESKLITQISDKFGNILYKRQSIEHQIMKDSTAFLINSILKDTAKYGTAKKLNSYNFDLCAKTGTVGIPNSKCNSDAFAVAYTSEHTIITYFGRAKMPNSISGATYPCMLAKDVLDNLYSSSAPKNFKMPSSVSKRYISKKDYEKNILNITSEKEFGIAEYFCNDNLPSISSSTISKTITITNSPNNKPIIEMTITPKYYYKLIRKSNDSKSVIAEYKTEIEPLNIIFEDKTAKKDEIYEYFAEICDFSNSKRYISNSVKLKSF